MAAAEAVDAALTGPDGYVAAAEHKGKAVAAATGTAIYFPSAGDVHVAYEKLDFAKDTRWAQLIKAYRGR